MKLVQIFLPLYDNEGRRFPLTLHARERERLVERFGWLTSHMRSPAHGLWRDGSRTKRDDIVILEMMVRRLDRKWWTEYRHRLQKRFKQKELLVRVQHIEVL
jgi:hypothetical protein